MPDACSLCALVTALLGAICVAEVLLGLVEGGDAVD